MRNAGGCPPALRVVWGEVRRVVKCRRTNLQEDLGHVKVDGSQPVGLDSHGYGLGIGGQLDDVDR